MENRHFSDLPQYLEALGLPPSEHPQLACIHLDAQDTTQALSCTELGAAISTDFYSISLKQIIAGEVVYGRTRYDGRSGTLLFTAPNQTIQIKGVKVRSEGRVILFHPDYVRGHPLAETIRRYQFFNYAVNEALHLTTKEQAIITGLFDSIDAEYQGNQDELSKSLVLSQITTVLQYAERFYRRQFLHREQCEGGIHQGFIAEIERGYADTTAATATLPSIEQLAEAMAVTPRYLSDALKAETGKTAIENLHLYLMDIAKDRLLGSDQSVASVAYSLGFEYPQYFARLFKQKVGQTPTEYRNRH